MATATKKIEASPFLVRRTEIVKKLTANKDWLEASYKQVREHEALGKADADAWDRKRVEQWARDNWDKVRHLLVTDSTLRFDNQWHQNWYENGTFTINIDLHNIPSFPPREASVEVSGHSLTQLSNAIKPAFMTTSDGRKEIPSRYQRICQYISLFEQSAEEFLDAKFYSDLPNLISEYAEQFETVGQIN